MKIFVDENIPLMTVRALRDMGHDVLDVRGTEKEGIEDNILWDTIQREKRLLITTDKGFTQHREELHQGILVVRLKQPNRQKIHQRVMQAITRIPPHKWPGLLVVMRDLVQSTWKASEKK